MLSSVKVGKAPCNVVSSCMAIGLALVPVFDGP